LFHEKGFKTFKGQPYLAGHVTYTEKMSKTQQRTHLVIENFAKHLTTIKMQKLIS